MKIGVMVESFRAGLDGGLAAAAQVGAQGVQIYATSGQMHPDNLVGKARGALKRRIENMGLTVSALCGDFGGHGFQNARENPKRIDDSKKILDLTLDLGCTVVTTHVGVVPADKAHPRYAIMAKAGEQLGRYGEKIGATFAIETGPEPAAVLRAYLDDIGIAKGIGVNFDPANLVMLYQENIPEAVACLAPYIVHTHAKDGKMLKKSDIEVLFGLRPPPGDDVVLWKDYILELPLGLGGVKFDTYLPALKKAGFDGFLTIEREVGEDPRKDIEMAVGFLKDKIEKLK